MPPTAVQAPNAWRVLFLLFLANLFNFFDRTIPAIVTEPVRREWNLSDLQIGLFGTAFTLIYALAGIPLGRLADSASRARIMGWGLTLWSGLTALNGLAWNFWSFLLMRMGVGIGEASYAPAANSLIGDLFPADRRARAMGLFMLGLPLGLTLAFFTVGAMVEAFGSWRAPFFLAAVPGLLHAYTPRPRAVYLNGRELSEGASGGDGWQYDAAAGALSLRYTHVRDMTLQVVC